MQWKNWTKITYKKDQNNDNRSSNSLKTENKDAEVVDNFCLLRLIINSKGVSSSQEICYSRVGMKALEEKFR